MTLTARLRQIKEEVMGYARDFGLDFFDTYFQLLDYDQINEVAAYGGFPTRYPHWRFGMEYDRMAKGHLYGLHKIYEMVINNDPCYAYLLEGNSLVEQKTVMAHVYAHCDFFKNNVWFKDTNRKMMNEMANHATRVRRYMSKHGVDEVEGFIDTCLSLENLIDRNAPGIRRQPVAAPFEAPTEEDLELDDTQEIPVRRLPRSGHGCSPWASTSPPSSSTAGSAFPRTQASRRRGPTSRPSSCHC